METAPLQQSGFGEEFETERLPVGWPWGLLIFSVILFGLALLSYFGLRFGYRSYVDKEIKLVDEKLAALSESVRAEEREQLIGFYSQIANLKAILAAHPFSSKVFTVLERYTISSIYFESAQLSTDETTLTVNGVSPSFDALGQQAAVLSRASEIQSVKLVQASFRENEVTFSFNIIFTTDFLLRK